MRFCQILAILQLCVCLSSTCVIGPNGKKVTVNKTGIKFTISLSVSTDIIDAVKFCSNNDGPEIIYVAATAMSAIVFADDELCKNVDKISSGAVWEEQTILLQSGCTNEQFSWFVENGNATTKEIREKFAAKKLLIMTSVPRLTKSSAVAGMNKLKDELAEINVALLGKGLTQDQIRELQIRQNFYNKAIAKLVKSDITTRLPHLI